MWHAEKGPLVILSSRALSLPLRAGSSPFHVPDTGPSAEKALHKPLCNSPSRFNMCAWDSVGCEPCALALLNAGLFLALASVSETVNAPAQMQPLAEQPRGVCHQQSVQIPALQEDSSPLAPPGAVGNAGAVQRMLRLCS